MSRPFVPALGLFAALLAAGQPAVAQQGTQRPGTARPPDTQSAPVPEAQPPAYEPDMLKLAEAIGSLAFLRQLCGAPDSQQWRVRMTELLEAEGVTPGRKERLAGAYNRGFKGFALTYRSCTAAATEAALRLSQDGERLSRSLGGRFGG